MTRKLFVALLLATLLLGALSVAAHEAPSGWSYSMDCCNTADCAQVEDEHIEEIPGGFRVTLPPGSHPSVKTRAVYAIVPHGDRRIRKSGDWRKHACISSLLQVLCIYLPASGS